MNYWRYNSTPFYVPIGLFIFLFTFGSHKFVSYIILFLFFICIVLPYLLFGILISTLIETFYIKFLLNYLIIIFNRIICCPSPLAFKNFTHAVIPLTPKCYNSSIYINVHLDLLFNAIQWTFKLSAYAVDNAVKFGFNLYVSWKNQIPVRASVVYRPSAWAFLLSQSEVKNLPSELTTYNFFTIIMHF